MRRVLQILGRGLQIAGRAAPLVAQIAFPGVAGIVEVVSGSILKAEAQLGAGTGLQKKEMVILALTAWAREALPPIATKFGRTIAPGELDQPIDDLVEALVRILKILGALPK